MDEEVFEEERVAYPVKYPLIFDHKHYVPRLLWRMGEYQALLNLHSYSKIDVTPLIDIPEVGYDFEKEEPANTIDEHLGLFANRLASKWENKWAFIDLELIAPNERMIDGRHPMKFIFDEVRNRNALAIPVTGLTRDNAYQRAVFDVLSADKSGVCIRLRFEDIQPPGFEDRLKSLLNRFNLTPDICHLIVDLQAPKNYEPLDGFTKMACLLIGRLPYLNEWRTFTVCGTSFPQTMGQLKPGVHIIKRYEWLFYKRLLGQLKARQFRIPTFGDYAIAHPEHVRKDPRLLKPAASIRYAINDAWYVVKGSNVRDNGTTQYVNFCRALVRSGLFLGSGFSDAGDYISKCARGRTRPGNLPTWRRVGTNHHIEKVVFDLASLTAS